MTKDLETISEETPLTTGDVVLLSQRLLAVILGNLSHRITNPLTGVINYSQIISEDEDASRDVREMSRRVLIEGERIQEFLLKANRAIRGTSVPGETADLVEINDLALFALNHSFRAAGVSVDWSPDGRAPFSGKPQAAAALCLLVLHGILLTALATKAPRQLQMRILPDHGESRAHLLYTLSALENAGLESGAEDGKGIPAELNLAKQLAGYLGGELKTAIGAGRLLTLDLELPLNEGGK